jgi:tuberculosinol/isotuberculosinol synthase
VPQIPRRQVIVDLKTFQSLPTDEIARLVREAGPKVCVFPINGTRRWFMLEHSLEQIEDLVPLYLDATGRRHIELYRLLFDHGLDTLLAPVFGLYHVERGEGYMQMAAEGLARLATHPDFLDFYKAYRVRVRFYGDYRKFLGPTPYAYLSDLLDEATVQTLAHDRYQLFFGLFAHDATETIAELAVRYYVEHGRVPDKRTLVEMYYGEYVAPVDLFIGFGKFRVFDIPLLTTGNEDLYFTVSPSPYLTEYQLRDILYDHLYARRGEPDYSAMGSNDWALMGDFYQANLGRTLGVGIKRRRMWYLLRQVELPSGFVESFTDTAVSTKGEHGPSSKHSSTT